MRRVGSVPTSSRHVCPPLTCSLQWSGWPWIVGEVMLLYSHLLNNRIPATRQNHLMLDQRCGSRSLEWIAKQVDAYEGQFLLRHDPYELRQACVPGDDFVWARLL